MCLKKHDVVKGYVCYVYQKQYDQFQDLCGRNKTPKPNAWFSVNDNVFNVIFSF